MPFNLLLLLLSKRYILYGLYLVLITLYAFILMQKSLILIALAPIMVFSLIRRRVYLFIKYVFIAAVVIFCLVLALPREASSEATYCTERRLQ